MTQPDSPDQPVGHAGRRLTRYDPNNQTGGGRFNPCIEIDLSHISVRRRPTRDRRCPTGRKCRDRATPARRG